jgi:5-methylthioadenosine/S-adenosylhomocysteine deaminase
VDSIWVKGDRIVTAGQVTTIDVNNLRHQLFQHSEWITQRRSQGLQAVEARYRSVMGLLERSQGYS